MTVLVCAFILVFCLADEGSNSLRFSFNEKKKSHRFYGCHGLKQIKIRNISVIRGKKIHHVVLLTKEAAHYVSPLMRKKNHQRFYGCHGLKQVKSVTSVISVAKIHHIVLLRKEATHYVSPLMRKKRATDFTDFTDYHE